MELEEIREKKNADEVFNLKDFSKDDRKWFFQRFYTLHNRKRKGTVRRCNGEVYKG